MSQFMLDRRSERCFCSRIPTGLKGFVPTSVLMVTHRRDAAIQAGPRPAESKRNKGWNRYRPPPYNKACYRTDRMRLSTVHLSSRMCLAAMLLAGAASGCNAGAENIGSDRALLARDASAGEGAFRHLQVLQDIATANGGNRAAGTSGYYRSAQYVADRLKEADYLVRFEEFDFPFFEERAPPILEVGMRGGPQDAAPGSAFRTLTNSGSGSVTAPISVANLRLGPDPPLASNSGCEAADFRDFERGSIALVRRGTCTFQTKVENAVAAGAAGVVIMNEGTEGRKDAFSGQLNKVASVPVLCVSYEFGRSLDALARHGTTVRIAVEAETGTRPTRNVLAETVTNGRGPLIIVGAHLDSVPQGPGINDNGSGSAAVLEAALRSARELAEAGIAVRFAFWGAEEQGLVGSRHHVASLSEEDRQRIALLRQSRYGRFDQLRPLCPGAGSGRRRIGHDGAAGAAG